MPTQKTKRLRAAIYLRASSDKQELSCDQQREELKKFCQLHGYAIVAEYVDDGKSASKDTDKRTQFLDMIQHVQRGEYDVVCVWDTSRLVRLNNIKAAKYIEPLMDAKVILHTVREGKFDFNDDIGVMMWNQFSMANNRYSTSLSANSIRGRVHIASLGWWASGKIPFGYDRQYVDGRNAPMVLVKRADKFSKPKGWHLTLKVNHQEAEVVRLIFDRFASEEISLRALADQLNRAGQLSAGKQWTADLLRLTLTNPAYVGRSYFGTRAHKWTTALNRVGEPEPQENACEPIIAADVWKRVQDKMTARRESGRKCKTASAGLLSGFLLCGHCGRRLEKRNSHGKVVYVCGNANKKTSPCRLWSVPEKETAGWIIGYLEDNVEAELLKLAEAKQDRKPERYADVLKSKIADLKRKIHNGRVNALAADPADAAALFQILAEWNAELREAEADLSLQYGEEAEDLLAWWTQRRDELVMLWQCPRKPVSVAIHDGTKWEGDGEPVITNPTKLKGLFAQIGLTVQVWWTERTAVEGEKKQRGRQPKYAVSQRKLSVRLTGHELVQRGDEICVDLERMNITVRETLSIRIAA